MVKATDALPYVQGLLRKLKYRDFPGAYPRLQAAERSLRSENLILTVSAIPGYLRDRDVPEDEIRVVEQALLSMRPKSAAKKKEEPKDEREPWQKGHTFSSKLEQARDEYMPVLPLSEVISKYRRRGLDANAAWGQLMRDTVLQAQFRTDAPPTFAKFRKLYEG